MTVYKEASTWRAVWIASLAGMFARWAWLRLDWRCYSSACNSRPSQGQSWAHQLKDSSWADDVHYHSDDDLVKELHRIMERLMST